MSEITMNYEYSSMCCLIKRYYCFSLKKMLSVINPRFECSICLNCLKDPTLTRCGHRFCYECIHEWLK